MALRKFNLLDFALRILPVFLAVGALKIYLCLPADGPRLDLLILPEASSVDEMPEEYVERLSESDIESLRYLRPSVERAIPWPEQKNREVILTGTRAEVPKAHRVSDQSSLTMVARGEAFLGYGLAKELGIGKGDPFMLLGKEFEVGKELSAKQEIKRHTINDMYKREIEALFA